MSEAQPMIRLRYAGPLSRVSTPSGTITRAGDQWGDEGQADWPADVAELLLAQQGDWHAVDVPAAVEMTPFEIAEES